MTKNINVKGIFHNMRRTDFPPSCYHIQSPILWWFTVISLHFHRVRWTLLPYPYLTHYTPPPVHPRCAMNISASQNGYYSWVRPAGTDCSATGGALWCQARSECRANVSRHYGPGSLQFLFYSPHLETWERLGIAVRSIFSSNGWMQQHTFGLPSFGTQTSC